MFYLAEQILLATSGRPTDHLAGLGPRWPAYRDDKALVLTTNTLCARRAGRSTGRRMYSLGVIFYLTSFFAFF
jgi:hypothetical protein